MAILGYSSRFGRNRRPSGKRKGFVAGAYARSITSCSLSRGWMEHASLTLIPRICRLAATVVAVFVVVAAAAACRILVPAPIPARCANDGCSITAATASGVSCATYTASSTNTRVVQCNACSKVSRLGREPTEQWELPDTCAAAAAESWKQNCTLDKTLLRLWWRRISRRHKFKWKHSMYDRTGAIAVVLLMGTCVLLLPPPPPSLLLRQGVRLY